MAQNETQGNKNATKASALEPSLIFEKMATPANTNHLTNPENKKLCFLVGSNMAAHYTLRHTIQALADLGIPCEIFLTDIKAKGPVMREKLSRPEVRNFAFFDKIMINHGYQYLEDRPMLLDDHGDLLGDVMYTPNQLAKFFSDKGVPVTVEKIDDIHAPEFIERIRNDDRIARTYNIRSMPILSPELIKAFENKTSFNSIPSQIVNCHPGDVILYPGTNIAFWARMNGYGQNTWTLHVMEEGVDTGPFLDRTSRALKPGKTLMQDMCSMAPNAAAMIINDAQLLFQTHTVRTPIPQNQRPGFNKRPKENYTYATHDEYFKAFHRDIRDVDPHSFLPATVEDYTGGLTSELSMGLHHILAKNGLEWQIKFIDEYFETYGYHCPQFNRHENPDHYFLNVPPAPEQRKIMEPAANHTPPPAP